LSRNIETQRTRVGTAVLTVNHMVEILLQAGRAASGDDDDDGGEGLGSQPDPFLCAAEPAMWGRVAWGLT
jgi:hypothetical protein